MKTKKIYLIGYSKRRPITALVEHIQHISNNSIDVSQPINNSPQQNVIQVSAGKSFYNVSNGIERRDNTITIYLLPHTNVDQLCEILNGK